MSTHPYRKSAKPTFTKSVGKRSSWKTWWYKYLIWERGSFKQRIGRCKACGTVMFIQHSLPKSFYDPMPFFAMIQHRKVCAYG